MPQPSKRTPGVEAEILRRLSSGEPLAVICRDDHLPTSSTWREWCRSDETLDIAHARARDDGYDLISARLRNTARGKTADDGGDSSGDVQRDKLIIDTDLKLLAKWDPKRYGDKVALTGGSEGDRPIQTQALVTIFVPDNGR